MEELKSLEKYEKLKQYQKLKKLQKNPHRSIQEENAAVLERLEKNGATRMNVVG